MPQIKVNDHEKKATECHDNLKASGLPSHAPREDLITPIPASAQLRLTEPLPSHPHRAELRQPHCLPALCQTKTEVDDKPGHEKMATDKPLHNCLKARSLPVHTLEAVAMPCNAQQPSPRSFRPPTTFGACTCTCTWPGCTCVKYAYQHMHTQECVEREAATEELKVGETTEKASRSNAVLAQPISRPTYQLMERARNKKNARVPVPAHHASRERKVTHRATAEPPMHHRS